ncbi:flippase-like domain-containing protein [Actinotalea sp. BY-33]|uniref:Flippase-like domain-containing protein n=1 Tax=Actinotalea soli TaxID=2819234 RepID=A0A939LNS9_9CELL|nr:lysylphosphatidylglycerol synthase domain-containing protein [Actinotalea soli]MBO1750943.1 flippase-like domain-containing protein [Actinotalea soli]
MNSPAAPPGAPRARRWPRLRRYLRPFALAVVAVFATLYLIDEWDEISAGLGRLDLGAVGAAFALVLLGLAFTTMTWRAALGGLGSPLSVITASRIFLLGELGKYVPGGVWPVVAQSVLSRDHGVRRTRAILAGMVRWVVSVVMGVVVAMVTLAFSSPEALHAYWWLTILAAGGVVSLVPAVFNWWFPAALTLVRRGDSIEPISARAMLEACLWTTAMWLAFGLHLWFLARSLGAPAEGLLLLTTGGYALAWVVGFVIVVLPAGAGAREAALVLVLATALSREDALVLALVSRFLMLLADGTSAGLAVMVARLGGWGHTVAQVRAQAPRNG